MIDITNVDSAVAVILANVYTVQHICEQHSSVHIRTVNEVTCGIPPEILLFQHCAYREVRRYFADIYIFIYNI